MKILPKVFNSLNCNPASTCWLDDMVQVRVCRSGGVATYCVAEFLPDHTQSPAEAMSLHRGTDYLLCSGLICSSSLWTWLLQLPMFSVNTVNRNTDYLSWPFPATQNSHCLVLCTIINTIGIHAVPTSTLHYVSSMDFQAPDWAGKINADRHRIWKYYLLFYRLTK